MFISHANAGATFLFHQIAPGIAVPGQKRTGQTDAGIFAYPSFEHLFWPENANVFSLLVSVR
jgi:hypothetical protein